MRANKIALLGLLTAIALTIFLVEAQIPAVIPVPGVKLGLSNIVTVYAVFTMGPWCGILVLLGRILLGSIFSGNLMALLYALSGGLLAIAVTIFSRRLLTERQLWIAGVLGGMSHNIGQLLAAMLVLQTPYLLSYLPILLISGIATGLFTGLCTQYLCQRLRKG